MFMWVAVVRERESFKLSTLLVSGRNRYEALESAKRMVEHCQVIKLTKSAPMK